MEMSLQLLSSATTQCLISDEEVGPGFVSREVGKAETVQEFWDLEVSGIRVNQGWE